MAIGVRLDNGCRLRPGAFVNHRPITDAVNTVRILTEGHAAEAVLGHSLSSYLPASLAWCAMCCVSRGAAGALRTPVARPRRGT